MSERDDDIAKLAKMMGWAAINGRLKEDGIMRFCLGDPRNTSTDDDILIPLPGAPLHEHLAFVGRIAEAIECRIGVCHDDEMDGLGWAVSMWPHGLAVDREWSYGEDPTHAAVRAAIATKATT